MAILSEKRGNGEQNAFRRIDFHIRAHRCIEVIFADYPRIWLKKMQDLAWNFNLLS